MSAKSQISKTIASSWLSLVIITACQLIMIPLALGALDKVDFALFAVITQMMMAIMLAEVGVRSACARLLIDARAQGSAKYNKVWMASVCVFCTQAVVMLLLILGLAPFLADIFNLSPEQRDLGQAIFLVVGLLNALGYALSIFSTALYAGQRLAHVNVVSAVTGVIQLISFTVAIKSGAQLWAYPISMATVSVFSNYLLIKQAFKYRLVGVFKIKLVEWEEVKTVFRLGMDVFVAAMFSVVMGNSLLLFSGHLLTLEQTAMLAVNLKLVSMMTNILQRIPGSASPMLMKMVSEGNDVQFRVWWKLITKATISIALICAGMFVIWNNRVVELWTSEDMLLGSTAVLLISLIPFRYLAHYQFVNSLTIFKEIRKVKWLLVWEVILYAGLAWVLAKQFGLIGLLSANLLSMLGGALFSGMKWFAIYSRIPFKALVHLFLKPVISLMLAFALLYMLGGLIGRANLLTDISLSFLWGGLSLVMGYLFILDNHDRGHLLTLLGAFRRRLSKRAV
ncbi:MAG: hypothetical protein H7A51_11160 [Akkermansiaceae bacterium]|nr:hypothetical protein [Akkermansiaceae bacterium]